MFVVPSMFCPKQKVGSEQIRKGVRSITSAFDFDSDWEWESEVLVVRTAHDREKSKIG